MSERGAPGRHPWLIAGVALTVYALDQASKSWAVHRLSDGSTIDLVGSLRFNLAFNSGAAFSRGTGFGPLIALLAIAIVLVLIWTSRSSTGRLTSVAMGLVLGGAVGNLSDRLLREGPGGFLGGAVVDFIDLQWWPIFNLADSAVVVGGILLVLSAGLAGRGEDEGTGGEDEGTAGEDEGTAGEHAADADAAADAGGRTRDGDDAPVDADP